MYRSHKRRTFAGRTKDAAPKVDTNLKQKEILTWKKLPIFVWDDVLAQIRVRLAADHADVVLHRQVVFA